MTKFNAAIAALLATTALATPVLAADKADSKQDATARQIQMLEDQLRAMQQQLNAMKAAQDQDKAAHDQEMRDKMAAEERAREAQLQAGAKIVFKDGKQVLLPPPPGPKVVEPANHRFQLSSGDGAWTIAPTGRLHFDVAGYLSQTPEVGQAIGQPNTRLSSGVNVRRGRFGVTGKAMSDFTWTLVLDGGGSSDTTNTSGGAFGGAANSILNTAQLSYTGFKNTSIDFGYFAQYFTMEESMSSNDILFLERSTPTSLASSFGAGDPRFGAGVRTWGPRYWFGAYITGTQPGAAHQQILKNWNGFVRASYQLVQEETTTVHVGAGVITTLQVPGGAGTASARQLTFSDRPELRVDPTAIFSTGAIGTLANPLSSSQVYNIETAATYGGFFYQGEYFHYVTNRTGQSRAAFDGGYAEVSYAWGGRRTYTVNCGCYGNINPIEPFSLAGGGAGAFEVAARISYADLTDLYNSSKVAAAQTPGFVNGGRQTNFTAAINWFINANMMFKLNYIHSHLDKANPTTTVGGVGIPAGFEMDAIAGRVQFVF